MLNRHNKKKKVKNAVIWIDNVSNLFAFVSLSVILLKCASIHHIYLFKPTFMMQKLLDFLKTKGLVNEYKALDSIVIQDYPGIRGSHIVAEWEDAINEISKTILHMSDINNSYEVFKRLYRKSHLTLFLEQEVIKYISRDVQNLMIINVLKKKYNENFEHFYIHPKNIFIKNILGVLNSNNAIVVKAYTSFYYFRMLLLILRSFKNFLLGIFLFARYIIYRVISHTHNKEKLTVPNAKVATELLHGINLSDFNDIFWCEFVKKQNIIIYRARERVKITGHIRKAIHRLGFEFVDRVDWKPDKASFKFAILMLKQIMCIFRHAKYLNKSHIPNKLWLTITFVKMEENIIKWSFFFEENNIKVNIHGFEWGSLPVVLAMAIEKIGGIDLGFQWSDGYVLPLLPPMARHVFIGRGSNYYELIKPSGFEPEVYVIGGNVFNSRAFNREKMQYVKKIRENLLNSGCRFIICIFDNGLIFSSGRSYNYRKKMEQFYEITLSWGIDDKEIGFIIKPKHESPHNELHNVSLLIKQLETQKRCVMLDSSVAPGLAARGSDLTIGAGYSSAVIESAAVGVPGIHFDIGVPLVHSRIYKEELNRIYFNDPDELYSAIKAYKLDSESMSWFGNHDKYIHKSDPFRNEKAPECMGKFINYCLVGIEKRYDWRKTLMEASRAYENEMGKEYIYYSNDMNKYLELHRN